MLTYLAPDFDMALRAADSTSALRVTGNVNPKIYPTGYIYRNAEISGDLVTEPRTGEKWLAVHTVDGVPLTRKGYVAIQIGAKVYMYLKVVTVPTEKATIVSAVITTTYSDGTVGPAVKYVPTP